MRVTAFTLLLVLLSVSLSSFSFAVDSGKAAAVKEDCIVTDDGDSTCKAVDEAATPDDDEDYFDDDHYEVDDDNYAYYDDQNDDDDDHDDHDDFEPEEDEADGDVAQANVALADPSVDCKDSHELCSFWASSGECINNPKYMLRACNKSCNNCNTQPVVPHQTQTDTQTSKQKRLQEKQELLALVATYGDPQKVDGEGADLTMLVIRKTIDYMENFIHAEKPTHRLTEEVIDNCSNNHQLCSFWASIGECDNNISFMQTKCAPSCRSCANIDFDTRCPKRSDDATPALLPGQLNQMFEHIVAMAPGNQTEETQLLAQQKQVRDDGMPYYTVHVHSRPETVTSVKDAATADDIVIADRKIDLKEAPWVVTFDNFLTEEECDHLIELGYEGGYERSTDVGTKTADGSYSSKVSTTRTSKNAWCSKKNGCRDDAIATRVRDRIANVTQIPSQNFEDYQMLKYEHGQFYRSHHDYIPHQKERACGPRILTFFLYLSDVEEGGGTGLDQINGGLVVNPKKGKALLWPSVLNYDPSMKDWRTTHEAIAVEEGTKFAANTWIHLYDVIDSQRRGCT